MIANTGLINIIIKNYLKVIVLLNQDIRFYPQSMVIQINLMV